MNKKDAQKIDDMTKVAAYKIQQAMSVFNHLEPGLKEEAQRVTQQRYIRLMTGERGVIIEGQTRIIEDEPETAPAPEPEPPTKNK